jgi:hypothetical protein
LKYKGSPRLDLAMELPEFGECLLLFFLWKRNVELIHSCQSFESMQNPRLMPFGMQWTSITFPNHGSNRSCNSETTIESLFNSAITRAYGRNRSSRLLLLPWRNTCLDLRLGLEYALSSMVGLTETATIHIPQGIQDDTFRVITAWGKMLRREPQDIQLMICFNHLCYWRPH